MKGSFKKHVHCLILLTIVSALPGRAPAAGAESALEEIIVTAQKRDERLQDVSAQVDVLTGSILDVLQIKQTPDIAMTVPNLVVSRNDTYRNSTIVLRSITQANNSDVPVAVIVDGVPQDDSKQFNVHLFDIAQIEVLKGPQGSLYGRNAEAGAVIITTARPTNQFKGFADISYGNGATVDASAGLSGAIVPDKALFRVAGSFVRSDGIIRNDFRGDHSDYIDHDWTVRANLLVDFTDKLRLDLIGQYGEFQAGTTFFSPVFSGNANDFQNPQGNFPGKGRGASTFISAKLEAQLPFATFTAVSGYSRITEHQISDVDFTNPVQHPEVFQVGDNQPSSNRIYSQDLRLVGPSGSAFRWLVSADYLNSAQLLSTNIFIDAGQPATDPFNPALLLVSSSANNKRSDYGVSAQVDYDLVAHLTLTAGLRYDEDKRRQINLNNGVERQADFNALQPKFTATYKFNPDLLAYVTVGVGFRSGGFNQPNFSIPIFNKEKLTNYEIGLKSQWFDRRLTLNGALFTGHVDNYQYSYIDFATASPVTGNIDRVKISGGELEAQFLPMDGLRLFVNLGVSVPTIERSDRFSQYVGNKTPRANDYSIQGGVDYTVRISDALSAFIGSNVQQDSKRYWFIDNLDVQNARTYVNANVGLSGNRWRATLWGKNLLDTRAYETYDPAQATGLPYDVAYPNRPLSYGIDLSYKF